MCKEQTQKEFLHDIRDHKMEIIRNDGVNRHLRFKREDSFCFWFDLVTWNGHICYTGDMGTYVFARIEDMFEFFIMDENDFNRKKGDKLNINLGYWAEKVLSVDCHNGIREYSSNKFEEAVKETFDNYFESEDEERKDEVWEEVKNEVLCYSEDGEHIAVSKAMEFRNGDFEFCDFWENDLQEYTRGFTWCLYAIVWGILEYRKQTEG